MPTLSRAPARVSLAAAAERGLGSIPDRWWRLSVVVIYLAVVTPALARHAFWSDEAQAWLIARASASLPELLANLRYEGHPPLWYVVIWPFAVFTDNPEWIKLLTWLFSGVTAVLVTRLPQLLRLEQVLLLGGFLMLVGYSTISRSYMLGVMLLVAYLWVATTQRSRSRELLLIGLLALTHAMFTLIAGAFLVGSVARWWRRGPSQSGRRPAEVASGVVAAGAIVAAIILILPAGDNAVALDPRLSALTQVEATIDRLVKLAFPLAPDWTGAVAGAIAATTALGYLAVCAVVLHRSFWSGGSAALAAVALYANALLGYGGNWWHLGGIYFAALAAVVLTRAFSAGDPLTRPLLLQTLGIGVVLCLQVCASIYWYIGPNAHLPYSAAREAAAIVRAECPAGCPLVTDNDLAAVAVSGYLGGQPIHRLNDGRDGTFVIWDLQHDAPEHEVTWQAVERQLASRGTHALAVLSRLRNAPAQFELVGTTGAAVRNHEEFIVVRLRSE